MRFYAVLMVQQLGSDESYLFLYGKCAFWLGEARNFGGGGGILYATWILSVH